MSGVDDARRIAGGPSPSEQVAARSGTDDAAEAPAAQMRELGCDRRVISADEAVRLEPALRHIRPQLAGATFTSEDESGDARQFTLALAEHAKTAIGVEIVPEAIENAKRNALRNGMENTEFFCADAGQAAQRLAKMTACPSTPHMVST